jgi:hypothetical protein
MANRADVYVRNGLPDNVNINVIRKLPDGNNDLETTIANGNEEMVHLPGPEVSLVISAPEGTEIKDYPIKVKSDVDLAVSYSRTDSNWAIKIVPNELPPDVPTTVNVNLGEDEPEPQ